MRRGTLVEEVILNDEGWSFQVQWKFSTYGAYAEVWRARAINEDGSIDELEDEIELSGWVFYDGADFNHLDFTPTSLKHIEQHASIMAYVFVRGQKFHAEES